MTEQEYKVYDNKLRSLDGIELSIDFEIYTFDYQPRMGSLLLISDDFEMGVTPYWDQEVNESIPFYIRDIEDGILYTRNIPFTVSPLSDDFISEYKRLIELEIIKFNEG